MQWCRSTRYGRNPSGMGIHQHCISGGQDDHLLLVEQCCLHSFSRILAILTVQRILKVKQEKFYQRFKEKLDQKTKIFGSLSLDLSVTFQIGTFQQTRLILKFPAALLKAAHPEETPLVVDPFAGGGSIPLEALRLGCEAFASDLNPVACLILKVMLEDIPRHGPELAEELRRVGKEIKKAAEKELAEFYPTDPDGSKPIAYLWARTVRCEAPNCGAEIPLMRSFWLCKKPNRKRGLRPIPSPLSHKEREKNERPRVEFEIFEPKSENDIPPGTVTRAKATCLCCGMVLSPDRVRAQLAAQRGGGDVVFDEKGSRIGGARLLAVVTLKPGEQGRHYRLPTAHDYEAVWKAKNRIEGLATKPLANGLNPVPDEPLPWRHGHRAIGSPRVYGMKEWGDLFTARQKIGLVLLAKRVQVVQHSECRPLLALLLGKSADGNNSLSRWMAGYENPVNLFSRQALPMVWDFCESTPASRSRGVFFSNIDAACNVIYSMKANGTGQIQQSDACKSPLPDDVCGVWFTDPPYYDAIPYADLSDFFYVWFRRTIPESPLLKDPFDPQNLLTPKKHELTVTTVESEDGIPKTRDFFEKGISKSFIEGRRILNDVGVGCIVFAHKTTEGWEALLSGIVHGGWTIKGSWPISTEMETRINARDTASLATSIHLVCRPRPRDAPVGDWGNVLQELPKRVGDWMERLQSEGIRGADLVFACIGPALEIYSRYSKVVDAEEREIPLGGDPEATEPHRKGFLAYVWEVVGRTALEHVLGTAEAKARNSAAGALEEDARLTALFLWTLQSTNGNGTREKEKNDEDIEEDEEEETPKKKKQGYSLIFDVVRRFAQPLGIHLPEWEGRVIETEKGVVRLLSVKERAKQLFGEESISVAGLRIEEQARRDPQMKFDFAVSGERAIPEIKGRRPKKKKELNRRILSESGGNHHPRPCSCCHASSGKRPDKCFTSTTQSRARPWSRFYTACQCALCVIS